MTSLLNHHLVSLIDAVPTAMLTVDADGQVVLFNREARRLFGYDSEEVIGKPVESLFPVRFREERAGWVRSSCASPEARPAGTSRAVFALRKDGREVPVEVGLSPVDLPDGTFVLASIVDLTERQAATERFRLVVEAAPAAMIMVDSGRRITLVNRRGEELFGYARNELLAEPVEILLPERCRTAHPSHVAHFLRTPDAREMGAGRALFGRRKDGSEVPIEVSLSPISTPDGLYTLAAVVDISERKRAELIHDQLAAIVESSDDPIIGKTLDGVITSWNRAAERLFGYGADEAVGQPIFLLVPERYQEVEAKLLADIRANKPARHFETVRRRKDGSEVEVSLSFSRIRDDTGAVVGTAAITRDITEAKRRDRELQRSNAELEQFAYIASHDLQEPLRMVANYTELLAQRYRGQLDERADRYIHYASDGAKRMQQLVADLLMYSRVGSQGKPLVPVGSGAVLARVIESLRRLVRETDASIEYGELPAVMADETQLAQLFQNLLNNAIKFRSNEPPKITIAAACENGCWRFSVSDNGIGMESQYAERIFQMFQRLHERGKYEGSGIGLAIAKRIVERHGGALWVESQPGDGSTFYFTLKAVRGVE